MQIILCVCVCVSRSLGHNTNGARRVWSPKGCTATATTDDDDDDESRAKRKTHKTAGDCYLNKYGGESHTHIYIYTYAFILRKGGEKVVVCITCKGARGVELNYLSAYIHTHGTMQRVLPLARQSVKQNSRLPFRPRLYIMYTCSCIILGCTALSPSAAAVVCIVFFEPARCKLPLPIRQPSSRPGSLL